MSYFQQDEKLIKIRNSSISKVTAKSKHKRGKY